MEGQHRRGRRQTIFSSWKTLVRVCSAGSIDMGQVDGERGGGLADRKGGGGVVSGLKQL